MKENENSNSHWILHAYLVDNKTMKSLILIIELERRGQGTSRMTSRNTKKIIRLTPLLIYCWNITGARGNTHNTTIVDFLSPGGMFPLWVSHSLLSYILSIFFLLCSILKSHMNTLLYISHHPHRVLHGGWVLIVH